MKKPEPMADQSGFLLIDKPAGCSSFDVIRRLRKITGVRKMGHTGTLDPFATGLLICALGSYTRLCRFIEAEDKGYLATLKFGEKTDTGDSEGEIVDRSGKIPEGISGQLVPAVLGLEELPTPQYSAVKIKGKPAYSYARKGIEMELPHRPARIMDFEILSYEPPYLTYACRVSKGTYIRSLSEFIAHQLGTVGHTVQLRRTQIGSIDVSDSLTFEEIEREGFANKFYPPAEIFAEHEHFHPDEDAMLKLRQGQGISQSGKDSPAVFLFAGENELLGVARRSGDMLFPLINLA